MNEPVKAGLTSFALYGVLILLVRWGISAATNTPEPLWRSILVAVFVGVCMGIFGWGRARRNSEKRR